MNVKLLLNFVLIAIVVGYGLDYLFDNRIGYWIHDAAIVSQARSRWEHMVVVALDDKIPINVSRLQALPLFALAAERLVAAGAKGIFLDARVSKEQEGRMPYASCIEPNGDTRWSMPQCVITANNQCEVLSSGNAPLKMTERAIAQFSMAPFLDGQNTLPDFLLFDVDAVPQLR